MVYDVALYLANVRRVFAVSLYICRPGLLAKRMWNSWLLRTLSQRVGTQARRLHDVGLASSASF